MGGTFHSAEEQGDKAGAGIGTAGPRAIRSSARSQRRRLKAVAACDGLTVTSSLSGNEPVGEAEIRLFLGTLGGAIEQIVGSGWTE